jgi:hypothetical protein
MPDSSSDAPQVAPPAQFLHVTKKPMLLVRLLVYSATAWTTHGNANTAQPTGVMIMYNDTPALDVNGLAVHRIQATPAATLDTAADAHGMTELAASCTGNCLPGSAFLPEGWDWAEA